MTTKVTRDNSSSGSRRTMTWSWWIKRSKVGATQYLFNQYRSSDQYNSGILFQNDDKFRFWDYGGSSNDINIITNRQFRDINSWYHIVLAIDTTQGTSSNRVKLYVNGVQETSFSTETYPNQNHDIRMNESGAASQQQIGFQGYGSTFQSYFSGIMSHVNFVDGAQLTPSSFGSTDSTTGEWKITTTPSVTYGTNGFFIFKDGNSVTNQAGNSSGNFTVGAGSLTKQEDCPSNVFCAGNPLARYGGNLNYANSNNHITGAANNWTMGSATMGAATGKWYFECKILSNGTNNGYTKLGFISDHAFDVSGVHIAQASLDGGYAFYQQNGNLEVRTNDGVISGYDNSSLGSIALANGDIMCLAVDMDNKKAFFRKNGDAWIKSANPVTGANGLDISADYPAGSTKMMIPAFAKYYPGEAALNFGNGYFGTTAVSSAGTNASGLGIFEYDVPTGYTALCTKGLNL